MLIKKRRRRRDYLLLIIAVAFFFTGIYIWWLKQKSEFKISSEFNVHDSILHINIKKDPWIGEKPHYTLLSHAPDMTEQVEVAGGQYTPSSEAYRNLPHYPKPVKNDNSAPHAVVLAVSAWSQPEMKPGSVYYKTFLPDTIPLMAVSLNGHYDHFFGRDGLYSVKNKNVKESTYPIHFELIDSTGNQKISMPVKATVGGMSTKKLPMKSLNLDLTNGTINSKVFFDDSPEKELYSFRIRNAGNDFLLAYLRDVLVTELCKSTHNMVLDYEPVAVFINGEFWGLQYIRERISKENLRSRFSHLERDQIQLGELHENQVIAISTGFDYKMGKLMQFVEERDLGKPENYQKLSQMINLDNFIDYVIVQTFITNTDWPHNNVKGVFLDDQLHFILYDADFAFNFPYYYQKHVGNYFNFPDRIHHVKAVTHNYFDSLDHYLPSHVGRIYQKLIKSEHFHRKFITRYREILSNDFSQHRIEQVVAEIKSRIAPLMPAQIARWGYPASVEDWHRNTVQIIEFCAERRKHVLRQLEQRELSAKR